MYSIIFLSLVLSVLSTTSCYVKDEAKKCIKDGSGEAKCKDDVKITKEDAMALCEDAFQDNMDITSFVFEGTDKLVIGKNAFKGATKLVSFTANSGIQSLGTSAFEGDVALTKIDLTGLAEIPESAFKGCSKLADVTGTENVATVQKDAFNGCVKLLSVNFYAPLTKLLDSLASQNNLFFHGTVQPTTLPDPTTPINNKLKVFVTDSYTAGTFGGLIALKANCTTLQCVDISTKIPDENPPQPAAKTEKALKCVDCDSKKMSVDGNNYYCEIDMTECIKTHTDCRICTKEKCQKCVISKYLEEDTCKQTCSDGYYKDTTEFMCNKCKDEKCKTCGADLECIECKDNHFLIEDTKKCTTDSTCPAGYYKEETAKKCVKCGSNCKVCTKDACTSCTTDSYYVDRNECKACSESITNCGKCTSQKECTKCSKGNLIKDKTKCVDTCPDKFYSANKVCTECEQSCKRCVEAGKCTECPDNDILLLDTGKCQSGTECPNGYSKDTTGKKCIKCIHFCKTCEDDKTCKTCADKYFFVEDMKKCVKDKCPDNYFTVEKTCKACASGCKTCTKADDCSACVSGKYLEEGLMKCVDKCEPGFFKKNETNCDKCSEKCAKCSVFEICDKCVDGAIMNENKCVEKCPKGSFEFDGKCAKCKEPSQYQKPCTDIECEICTASSSYAILVLFALALILLF